MAEVLLFHHAQGLTPGVVAFADELRAAGHGVTTPDLYEGRTFDDLNDGVAHAKQVGFDVILERGRLAGEGLPGPMVYAGFSLGAMPAQLHAQTRPGAKGALLFSGDRAADRTRAELSGPGRLAQKIRVPPPLEGAGLKKCSATTYSPAGLPRQYHRRWRA